jgi:hypothetical protein
MRLTGPLALALLLVAPAAADELPAVYADAVKRLRVSREARERAQMAVGLGHGFRVPESPGAHPKILEALFETATLDPDATVQVMAAYSLCLLADRRGVPRLIAGLRAKLTSGDDPRQAYSPLIGIPTPYLFRALARVGGDEAMGFLLEVARKGEKPARLVAIPALGLVRQAEAERAERALTALAADPDVAVSGVAQFTLDERRRRAGR